MSSCQHQARASRLRLCRAVLGWGGEGRRGGLAAAEAPRAGRSLRGMLRRSGWRRHQRPLGCSSPGPRVQPCDEAVPLLGLCTVRGGSGQPPRFAVGKGGSAASCAFADCSGGRRWPWASSSRAAQRLGRERAHVGELQRRWWSWEQEEGKLLNPPCPICPPAQSAPLPARLCLPSPPLPAAPTARRWPASARHGAAPGRPARAVGLWGRAGWHWRGGKARWHAVTDAMPGMGAGFPTQGCSAQRLAGAPLCAHPVPAVASPGCAPAIQRDKFQLQSICELLCRASTFPPSRVLSRKHKN